MATRFMAARWFLSSEVSTVRSGRAYTLLVVPCVQTRAYGLGHYVFRVYIVISPVLHTMFSTSHCQRGTFLPWLVHPAGVRSSDR